VFAAPDASAGRWQLACKAKQVEHPMSTTLTRRAILAGASAIAATAALIACVCAIDSDAELRNLAARYPALERIKQALARR